MEKPSNKRAVEGKAYHAMPSALRDWSLRCWTGLAFFDRLPRILRTVSSNADMFF
jgi:hypothetical protein